jgi:ATP-dependent Clp protease ATP-binding subunit ClpA
MARRSVGFADSLNLQPPGALPGAAMQHAGAPSTSADGDRDASAERAFERLFSPEFRNRLDGRLQFQPLTLEVMEKIVGKLGDELTLQLAPKGVRLEITAAARRLLAERGYDPAFGARPLARLIEDAVKRPLTQELLWGALQAGGTALVDVETGADGAPAVVVHPSD